MIAFPHLGITLEHVGRSFSLFQFEIAYYGVIIAVGMILGISLIQHVARQSGQDEDSYFNLSVLTMLVGILGARAYYVLFSWDYYGKHPLEIFDFRGGGLAIYGGIIAGVLFLCFYCRRKKMPVLRVLDTCIVGVPLGQAIGRWGNFFNREAFGEYTDSLAAMKLPLAAVYPGDVTETMMAHAVTEGEVTWIQVHPTFLYESVWNLCVFAALMYLTKRMNSRRQGMVFSAYLILYGIGRFFIEGLRTDQLLFLGYPVSRLVSLVLIILGTVFEYRLKKSGE